MGQILIIHDDGEVAAALGVNHSVMQLFEASDLRRTLGTHVFQAAILVGGANEATVAALRAADPDLTLVLVAATTGDSASERLFWEVVPRPLHPDRLQAAVQRAIQHTALLRENRVLRGQSGVGAGAGMPSNIGSTPGADSSSPSFHWITSLPPRLDLRALLSAIEKRVIMRMLEATHGAQAEAARRLGLSRSDLSYKLAKYELRRSPASVSATQP